MRFLTSILWVFVTLAFGFDAVAQPCELRVEAQSETAITDMSEMPCHRGMVMDAEPDAPSPPMHEEDTCCCAALLTNAVTFAAVNVDQPLPGLTIWAPPFPDNATSIALEYEPPPPRA